MVALPPNPCTYTRVCSNCRCLAIIALWLHEPCQARLHTSHTRYFAAASTSTEQSTCSSCIFSTWIESSVLLSLRRPANALTRCQPRRATQLLHEDSRTSSISDVRPCLPEPFDGEHLTDHPPPASSTLSSPMLSSSTRSLALASSCFAYTVYGRGFEPDPTIVAGRGEYLMSFSVLSSLS